MGRFEELTEDQHDIIMEASRLRPLTQDWFERAKAAGMISRKDLVDGKYYLSDCRNCSVGRWSAEKGLFEHMRTKFTMVYVDTLYHPENDDNHDLFVPFKEVEPTEDERIK